MSTLRKPTLWMLLIAAVLMAGCKKENNSSTSGNSNPNPAQDTPLSENMFAEFQSVYQLYPNHDGSFYALAGGDYTDYLLKLDNNGYVQQRVELGFRSRRCITKSDDNIVLVGNLGSVSTPYNMYEQGYIAVFDNNMQLVTTVSLTEPSYKIELYTVKQDLQNPTLFYAGGMAIDGKFVQYPYICTLRFSEGVMTKESSRIFSDYAQYRIVGMVEIQSAGQSDLILETIHYDNIDDPYNADSDAAAHIVKLNYFGETTGWGHDTWDVAITGPRGNSYTGNNSMDSDENNVYFFGFCNDDKTPTPASDGYWDSGCVAAVNWHQGQMAWSKVIPFSKKDDRFVEGWISNGCLYACGCHSGLLFTNSKEVFSNGLVAKLSLSGELISYKTFGDPKRRSWLFSMVNDSQGNMACAGHSDENLGSGKTKWSGWFLKTDMSSSSSKAILETKQEVEDETLIDMEAGMATAPMCDEAGVSGM